MCVFGSSQPTPQEKEVCICQWVSFASIVGLFCLYSGSLLPLYLVSFDTAGRTERALCSHVSSSSYDTHVSSSSYDTHLSSSTAGRTERARDRQGERARARERESSRAREGEGEREERGERALDKKRKGVCTILGAWFFFNNTHTNKSSSSSSEEATAAH